MFQFIQSMVTATRQRRSGTSWLNIEYFLDGAYGFNARVGELSVRKLGSLRIDDFCTTTPLGHVIVPSRRRRNLNLRFTVKTTTLVRARQIFPPFLKFFFLNFLFTSRVQFKPKCLTRACIAYAYRNGLRNEQEFVL